MTFEPTMEKMGALEPALMLDLETLGTAPGSVITAAAAVAFIPATGDVLRVADCTISISSCLRAGLTVDGATLQWWLTQDQDVRARVFESALPLHAALTHIHNLFWEYRNAPVWAYGASFDPPIWEAACRAVELPRPWGYREIRCCRTMLAVAGVSTRDHQAPGDLHDPLVDCRTQVAALKEAFRRLAGETD